LSLAAFHVLLRRFSFTPFSSSIDGHPVPALTTQHVPDCDPCARKGNSWEGVWNRAQVTIHK
jgi:hypothetical protein